MQYKGAKALKNQQVKSCLTVRILLKTKALSISIQVSCNNELWFLYEGNGDKTCRMKNEAKRIWQLHNAFRVLS